MLVTGGTSVNFNYPTFDQVAGLYVAATVYEVTSGTAVISGSKVPMTDIGNGTYVGSFVPAISKSYLVISAVYLDSGFTTVDSSRAPAAENYDAFVTDTSLLNFNYGAYDQDPTLTLSALVYNVTDSTSNTVSMAYVALGVYFGHFQGVVGKHYAVIKSPSDLSRPPGCDSFQAFVLTGGGITPPPQFSATYYDIEHLLRDIQALLVAYLNSSITGVENAQVADGLSATGLLPVDTTHGYFIQSWSPANMNINPAVFIGVDKIQTVGVGPTTSQQYEIFVELVLVDNGMDKLGIPRIHRYTRAIRQVFEQFYDQVSRSSKIKIETIRPISFKLDSDSSEEIRVGGVSITTALA